jgi:ribosomal protein S18 acetylase RimI-like enzyme
MMVSAEHDPRRAGTIWTLGLDQPAPVVTPLAPATFCRVEPASAPELAEVMADLPLAEVLKRFELGRRCYAARVDGRLAAYGWVSFDEELVGELNLRLCLLPGEAYIWNCATLPAFRRNHLYSALLVYIVGELKSAHLSRAWIGADLDNLPSQRGIARAGFTYVADLFIARVLALRQVWIQGQPDIPEHLVAEARRAFLNNRDRVWRQAWSSDTPD